MTESIFTWYKWNRNKLFSSFKKWNILQKFSSGPGDYARIECITAIKDKIIALALGTEIQLYDGKMSFNHFGHV